MSFSIYVATIHLLNYSGQESKNIRKIRRFGRVEEQSFSLVFIQLELVVDGPLLYIAHTVLHVAEKS